MINKDKFNELLKRDDLDLPFSEDDFKDNYVTADIRLQQEYNKKRRNKMSWLIKIFHWIISIFPFGKDLLVTGLMVGAKWFIRNIVQNKMTPELMKHITVTKSESGDYSIGVNTSQFQRDAYATPQKWDNSAADLAIVVNEELYKLKVPSTDEPK